MKDLFLKVVLPLAWVIGFGFAIYGYIMNIVKLVQYSGEFDLLQAVRIVGVIFPELGILMGFVNQ